MTEVTECLRQGDARWRSEILGDSQATTIGQAGCLLVCLAEARLRLLKVDADPVGLNTLGRLHRCFSGAGAIVDKLAKQAGLACGVRIAGDLEVMRAVIVQALLASGAVLLHVDHDSKRPGGDVAADHWVLGISLGPDGRIAFCDPATGAIGHLGLASLSAPSGWRDKRVYSVRGLRVLTALQ
jgi:hypothetical protein